MGTTTAAEADRSAVQGQPVHTEIDRRAREILSHLASDEPRLVEYLNGEASHDLPALRVELLIEGLASKVLPFRRDEAKRIAEAVALYRNTYLRRRSPCLLLFAASDDDGQADSLAATLSDLVFGSTHNVLVLDAGTFPPTPEERESLLNRVLDHAGVVRLRDVDLLAKKDGAKEWLSRAANLRKASTYGNQIVVATLASPMRDAKEAWSQASSSQDAEAALRPIFSSHFQPGFTARANLLGLLEKPSLDDALLNVAAEALTALLPHLPKAARRFKVGPEALAERLREVVVGGDGYMSPTDLRKQVQGVVVPSLIAEISQLRGAPADAFDIVVGQTSDERSQGYVPVLRVEAVSFEGGSP